MCGFNNRVYEKTVFDMATLRTMDGTSTDGVMVLGYYTPGDGGGGPFYWTSDALSPENYGTVIVPTAAPRAGCWKRAIDNPLVVHVAWFGTRNNSGAVRADGTTDDTAAINRAVSILSNGGTLVFPGGTYWLTGPINIKNKLFLNIEGKQSLLLGLAAAWGSNPMLNFAGTKYSTVKELRFQCILLANQPTSAIFQTRDTLSAGGNTFSKCNISGKFSRAGLENAGDENAHYLDCELSVTNQVPTYLDTPYLIGGITPESNVQKHFYRCTLANSGTYPNKIVHLYGQTQETTFRDCYFITYNGNDVIYGENDPAHPGANSARVTIDTCRVEGDSVASARLIYAGQDFVFPIIRRLTWSLSNSTCLIDIPATKTVRDGDIDLGEIVCATGCILVKGSLNSNRLVVPGTAKGIYIDVGGAVGSNTITTFEGAFPLNGPNLAASDGVNAQSNLVIQASTSSAMLSVPAQRRQEKTNVDGDTTPSVQGHSLLSITNTNPTSITNFDGQQPGHLLTCIFRDNNTTVVHNLGKIILGGSANFVGTTNSTLTLFYDERAGSGAWREISRMVP